MSTIVKPLISEKTLNLVNTENKYTFVVKTVSNKIEVAKEIESKFNVTVTNIQTLNQLGKSVSTGKRRISGKRSDFKKAVVTLKKGDKIAQFDIK